MAASDGAGGRAGVAGPGRGRRGVPDPHRAAPPGTAGALLPLLGSFQDAEDALQETLLAAWRGFDGFEGRASVRTWRYRIATNRCLNVRRATDRRTAREWDVPGVHPPEPTTDGRRISGRERHRGQVRAGMGVGRDLVIQFCDSIFRAGRRFDLRPTRANGQPAFGAYLRTAGGDAPGVGLYVLTVRGEAISA